MVIRAARELSRRSSLRRQDEELCVPGLEIPFVVGAIHRVREHAGRRRPLGALGLRRHGRDRRFLLRHEHGEGEPLPVRRPGEARGRAADVGELSLLARVHPTEPDLGALFVGGDVRQTTTVRRPARRHVVPITGRQRSKLGSVDVDDPEIRSLAILHDVHEVPNEDDLFAVG